MARLLSERLAESQLSVLTIHQDEHVVLEETLPLIRDKRDWEVPESIDWANLHAVIKQSLGITDVVILEGLFCYANPKLIDMMDVKIFVEIEKALFVSRKKEDLRWGSLPEPDWYIEHIWQSYLKYGMAQIVDMDYRVDGKIYFESEENIGTSFFVELPIAL